MSNTRLCAIIDCFWYHDREDGPIGYVMSENHSCMNTITGGHSWLYWSNLHVVSGDQLSRNNCVMMETRRKDWVERPIIKSSHRPRRWKEPSSSSIPLSDITSKEHLKILLRNLSTIQNYFPIVSGWIPSVWVRGGQHIPTTHNRGSLQLSGISFTITTTRV
jgi:hypothetical protein